MAKKNLEEEIAEFLDIWGAKEITDFLYNIIPLFELYDVEDSEDWVEENTRNIRLVSMIYLISKIAEAHAGRFCSINVKFKNLWKRIEEGSVKDDE